MIRRRRLFLSRTIALLLVFLMVFSASSFTPIHKVRASDWAGWDAIDTIYYDPAQDDPTNKFLEQAATELRDHLQKVGKTLTIDTSSRPDSGIYLEVNSNHSDLTGRNDEAFKLYSDANGLYITGKTPIAVRHGAYTLLEKLGFRWFFKHPAWWVVPNTLISLDGLNEVQEPVYIWRNIGQLTYTDRNRYADWAIRNRLFGTEFYYVAHSYANIIAKSEWNTNPEWFLPELPPEATELGWPWQLRPDHPEVVARAIDYARNILSQPAQTWTSVWNDKVVAGSAAISPNDAGGWDPPWDEDTEEGRQTITDKVFYLANEVAKAIQADFPDRYVGLYCYAHYSNVPSFDLEPNLLVEIATDYNFGDLTLDEQIQGFSAKGVLVGIRDYLDVWQWWHNHPNLMTGKLNALTHYADQGARVYYTEAGDGWGGKGPAYYAASKLLWDPYSDLDAILDDFYTKAFGPAKETMKSYYSRYGTGSVIPEETLLQNFLDLAEAESLAAGNNEILERIRQLEYYQRYLWFWRNLKRGDPTLDELKEFYTFVNRIRYLYILFYNMIENELRNELKTRGLTDSEIDALQDFTPPTVEEAAVWLSEALTALGYGPAPPVLNPIGDKSTHVGWSLQFTVSATDPNGDALTYSANNTPPGASFNAETRTFSWTPTADQTGTYPNVQFMVSDGSFTDSENITITVTVNNPPVLNSIGDKSVNEGQPLQFVISATDPDNDPLTHSASNLPSGASFTPSTRTFSWTPAYNQAGTYPNIVFNVTDSELSDSDNITITVEAASPPPPPPSGGGGGGGGGGGSAPGFTNVSQSTTSTGRFTEDVTAKSTDGQVELSIPDNAIGQNRMGQPLYYVSIKEKKPPPDPPPYAKIVGEAYDFGPSGATFEPSIDLTFEYDDAEVPEGVAEKNLLVATYDGDTEQWQNLESIVDPENNTVATKVSHLSTFAILAYTHPASFEVTDLSVTPREVDFGEIVSIDVLVNNNGDLTGSYEAILQMDDVVIQTKEITLDGGDSETVSFSATPETAGQHKAGVGDSLATFTVKEPEAPAAFTISGLIVTPNEITLGESVDIGVLVVNNGDLTGSYEAILQMDDMVMQSKEVMLNGGDSVMINFSVTADSIGQHTLNIDGLVGTFEVKAPQPPVAEEASNAGPEISRFNVTPIYNNSTGKFISTRIDYQINKAEELTREAELTLKVFFEGELLEEMPLLSLSQLQSDGNTGSLGYIPSLGWKTGTYVFRAELHEGDGLIQSTQQERFTLIPESITRAVSWGSLGVIIGATLIFITVIVALILWRKRDMLRDYME